MLLHLRLYFTQDSYYIQACNNNNLITVGIFSAIIGLKHLRLKCEERRRIKAAFEISERFQTTTYIKFYRLENRSQITYLKTVIAFVLENHNIRFKYEQDILLHIQNKSNYIYLWWKGKGTT